MKPSRAKTVLLMLSTCLLGRMHELLLRTQLYCRHTMLHIPGYMANKRNRLLVFLVYPPWWNMSHNVAETLWPQGALYLVEVMRLRMGLGPKENRGRTVKAQLACCSLRESGEGRTRGNSLLFYTQNQPCVCTGAVRILLCYGLNLVTPPFICWIPNP